ncbi:MAG: FG-GAP repeat protein, partial [Gammaproteobacteria bacterium]|nr:FG-GAP repeat protein [Gammaproteobacteria bacterium]
MMTQVRKNGFGRKSLLAMSVMAALAAAPVSATLVDNALTITPATSLTVGGVTLPEAFQQAGDLTGLSVATDGVTLVIGAPQVAGKNLNSFGANLLTTSPVNPTILQAPGKAYVYQRDVNSNWVQIATLMASAGADTDGFGVSVAVDGNTIVVGADGAASNKVNKQGRVYVFEKPIGGWSNATIINENAELLPTIIDPVTTVAAPLNAATAYFGHAVEIKGGTVVVGQWGAL